MEGGQPWPPPEFDVDDLLGTQADGLDWTSQGLLGSAPEAPFRLSAGPGAPNTAGTSSQSTPGTVGANGGPLGAMYAGSMGGGDMRSGMMNGYGAPMPPGSHAYGLADDGESSKQTDYEGKDPTQATPGNSLKRGMACGFCRKRKLRCSGEKPSCSNCIRFRKTCEYAQPPPSKRNSTEGPPATTAGPSSFPSGPQTAYPGPNPQLSQHMLAPNFADAGMQYFDPPNPATPYGWNQGTGVGTWNQSGADPYASLDLSFPPTYADPSITPAASSSHPYSRASPYVDMTPPSNLPSYLNQIPPTLPSAPAGFSDQTYPLTSQPLTTQPLPSQPPPPPSGATPGAYPSRQTVPMRKISGLSPSAGRSATPEDPTAPAPPSSTVDPRSPGPYASPPPLVSAMYTPSPLNQSHIDPIEGITERLGEFLFSPLPDAPPKNGDGNLSKKIKTKAGSASSSKRPSNALWKPEEEFDGLSSNARTTLLDTFLAHSRLFFEMSVPRFRYRLTFTDRRRPSLAFLYTMYLWGARMSGNQAYMAMEPNFYNAACQSLDAQTSSADRLLDATRAAMLLSAYAYSSGRYHEGWLLAGVASRVVLSTGIHQIASCVFKPSPPRNPLLRNKVFLLPPAEDAMELGERIHTFWAVYAIERCGAIATSFPSCLRDEDITTPFPRPLADIASGNVTHHDDLTVRDFYQQSFIEVNDTHYVRWVKGVTLLERASKLAFRDPEEGSEFSNAWATYSITLLHNPATPAPPPWLDQPKYRCPKEYRETKLGLDLFVESMGVEGIFPVDRKRTAEIDSSSEPFIPSSNIIIHHQLAAVFMLLHDINSLDCENKDAVGGARKSIALMRSLPQIPFQDVDSFVVLIWSLIAKTLIKEMHRLKGTPDAAALMEADVDVVLGEMSRIGMTMALARSHQKALEELKTYSPGNTPDGARMQGF